jgi:hypothetical protein
MDQVDLKLLVVLLSMRDDNIKLPWSWYKVVNYYKSNKPLGDPLFIRLDTLSSLESLGYIRTDSRGRVTWLSEDI